MSGFDLSRPGEASRLVDTRIYTRKAIVDAQTAFRDHCAVQIRSIGGSQLIVTIKPPAASRDDLRATVLEFWNYVLDSTCQARLA